MAARLRRRIPLAVPVALMAHGVVACSDPAPGPVSVPVASIAIVSGNAQTAEVATTLPQPLVVLLRAPDGAPSPATVVRLISDGRAIDSVTTNVGIASLRWTLASKAEVQSVLVRGEVAGRVVEVVFTATATPGAPAAIRVSTATTVAAPATALDAVSALVHDRFENPVPSVPVAWSVESGGGTVRALSDRTDADGVARAILTLGPDVGDNVFRVTAAGFTNRLTATGAIGLPASQVVVGAIHSCAIDAVGAAYCWGSNQFGQLGIGRVDEAPHPIPGRVAGGLSFARLTAGTFHTCGLTRDGAVYCWGGNFSGQLGSTPLDPYVPARVAGRDSYVAIAAGGHHTCGLTSTGTAMCWGDGGVGQLGDGRDRTTTESLDGSRRPFPAPVVGGHTFVALAANNFATCALTRDGETWCWGGNGLYELGGPLASACRMPADPWYYTEDYDWPCSTTPVRVALPGPLASISAVFYSVCGVTTSSALVCWGSDVGRPAVIPGARVAQAWTLGQVVCGLDDARVSCWRAVTSGSLSFPAARPHDGTIELVNLAGSAQTFCGLSRTTPALVYCWGTNDSGQLGDGTTERRSAPAVVRAPPR